jgi:hypothetical protein
VALAHWVLAFAIFSGIGHSGARYFYCEAFGITATDPCVQASQSQRSPVEALDESVADCCELLTLPAMPEGARAAGPSVPPAARVAVVPAGWPADLWMTKELQSATPALQRWRPPPRAPNELRAQLMVFLT